MVCLGKECKELDITIADGDLVNGVLQVVCSIRPQWPLEQIRHSLFNDGITNKLVGVHLEGAKDSTILVRIYGENTEKIIDREAEMRNIKILESIGFAPKLYASFKNGIAYEFFPGKTLNVGTCRDEIIFPKVAERMAVLHQQLNYWTSNSQFSNDATGATAFLWDKIKLFLSLVPGTFDDPEKQARFQLNIPSLKQLKEELEWMKITFEELRSPIVFCHNDLLLANILYDDRSHSIHFIDLEYAGPNYQAYDIANHFCEFAGVDTVDHSLYPNEDFRRKWILVYLRKFHGRNDISEEELQVMLDQVETFSIASHFFWGVWALIQAAHSTIAFDFIGYSASRLGEYFRKKAILN